MSNVNVDFDRLVRETDSAFCIAIGDWDDEQEYWVPKSQCHMHEDEGYVNMPEWLATEKGLV